MSCDVIHSLTKESKQEERYNFIASLHTPHQNHIILLQQQ